MHKKGRTSVLSFFFYLAKAVGRSFALGVYDFS